MTSRERMRRTLEFDRPDRVPRDLWMLPIARLEHGSRTLDAFQKRWPVDIGGTGLPGVKPSRVRGKQFEIGVYVDEWGCEFENVQSGVHGEVKRPLLEDWSRLQSFEPPREMLEIDVQAVNAQCRRSDLWCQAGCCPRPFERLQFLRGTENVMIDLAEESADFKELLARVHRFYCQEVDVWAATEVDSIMIMDDWGSQRSLLISPKQWRRLFKPLYKQYVQIAHNAGKKLFMHSDGHIFDIYPDLIEIGVDAINSQLFCMDIEDIGRQFAGKITFWGEIDRQHILPNGTVDEARAAVLRVVDSLYRPEGGVIAQFELGPAGRLENAAAIFQAWQDIPIARQ